jgi:hypothetical protein
MIYCLNNFRSWFKKSMYWSWNVCY